jgi:dTDP-4-dehydrorhamnose reductase
VILFGKERNVLKVVAVQHDGPTPIRDIAATLLKLVKR